MAPVVVAPSPRAPVGAAPCPAASPADGTCLHCGLRLPARRYARGDRFCCDGCERVHALLREAGLQRYYELRRGPGIPAPELRPDAFAWLERVSGDGPVRARRRSLDVQGVHCAACVWVLQELFRRHAGAVALTINPAVGRAEIAWNDEREPLADWLREAEHFGYRFGPARKTPPATSRDLLVRLAVCSAAAMNTMIFSLSFYFGLAPQDGLLPLVFGRLALVLGTVAAIVGGGVFVRRAVAGLRRRLVHLDLPIALGVVLAWAGSVHEYFARGPESAYFDSVSIFVTLMLLGRWLSERQLDRNRQALLTADDLGGLSTRRIVDGVPRPVAAARVATGDELCVVAGDLVPVEGVLLDRPARVRLDWIDGESAPRELLPGDRVPAGAFNTGASPFRLTATEDFASSRLHELLSRPVPERHAGAPFWQRLGTAWAAGVLVAAAAGFLLWWPRGTARALEVTVSILVVTCPCAIGLAVPLARDLVHGALRRRGVFVREPGFLDRALSVRRVLFDKTGTLTRGGLAVTGDSRRRLAALPGAEREILRAMAIRSNHPSSRAIAAALDEVGAVSSLAASLPGEDPVRERPGAGLEWRVDGVVWRLGRRSFALPDTGAADDGATWWSRDGVPRARVTVEEQFRADTPEEVRELAWRGLELGILSGDDPRRVAVAALRLGLPPESARGGLSPEAKAELVRAVDRGDTLFVGDGLNDGPAFDAAACAATPAVDHAALPTRADFYFLGGGLVAVRHALEAARTLRRVVRANLAFSVAYNVVALTLCAAGLVRPAMAAVLMPLSSLAVVSLTAARLSEARLPWK